MVKEHLTPGQKVVQTSHALADFAVQFPQEFTSWQSSSNYLCCLEQPDFKFDRLIDLLELLEIKYSVFYEPDIDQNTAVAVGPLNRTEHRKIFKNFKLTLS